MTRAPSNPGTHPPYLRPGVRPEDLTPRQTGFVEAIERGHDRIHAERAGGNGHGDLGEGTGRRAATGLARCYICGRVVRVVATADGRQTYAPHGPSPGEFCAGVGQVADGSVVALLDPKDPISSARLFVGDRHLLHQCGIFYRWERDDNAWLAVEEAVVRAEAWSFLERARRRGSEALPGSLAKAHVPFCPTQRAVSEVVDAVRGVTNLPQSEVAPRWLDGRKEKGRLVALRNGLLRLSTRELLPPDPGYYNHVALPFHHDADARETPEWHTFLRSLWADDEDSVACLQEVFGYLVSGETRHQKILLIVGPKRSGKGTIARVLWELLGRVNVCGPTLASLAENFGLEPLVHKSLAVVSDARITGRSDTAVMVEQLLSISGEDVRSVARKFLPAWSGQLGVRFLLLTNELPRIEDASGALASRFVILRMTRSFYGNEDLGLFDRLVPELPAILNWSLDGWDRLRERGHFAPPSSSEELAREFEDLGSPIGTFVRELCEVGEKFVESQKRVFGAWRRWCEENGRQHVGTAQTFAKDLRAAFPEVGSRKLVLETGGKQERCWEGLRLVPPGGAVDPDPDDVEVADGAPF